MTHIGRARRCASFGVPCIAILALGVVGQVAGNVKTPQTIIAFVVADPIPGTRATETTLASKRTRDLVIAITSSQGGLKSGENSFCVLFQKAGTDEPADVRKRPR